MDSILTSVKKLLGITEDYEHFDTDIILCINSVFSILTQLGVGPKEGFTIQDKSSTWADFLGDDPRLEMVKTYVFLRTRLLFDPPSGSSLLDAIKRTTDELEWRLTVVMDEIADEETASEG